MMAPKDISIILADDHPMLLSGLSETLIKKGYKVLGKAINGTEALDLLFKLKPRIAILDVDMPFLSGFEVVKLARQKKMDTRFIILSLHREAQYVSEAKSLTIQGYLLKEDPFSEIEKCIEAVLQGEEYYSAFFDEFSLENTSEELRKLALLTFSETAVLKLVAQNSSNNQIGETLCVSYRTVEKHRSNIIQKLALESGNNALLIWAVTNKKTILNL